MATWYEDIISGAQRAVTPPAVLTGAISEAQKSFDALKAAAVQTVTAATSRLAPGPTAPITSAPVAAAGAAAPSIPGWVLPAAAAGGLLLLFAMRKKGRR